MRLSKRNFVHRISKGMVHKDDCGVETYCELWQVGYHSFELRVKIPKTKSNYVDIHYKNISGDCDFYIRGSFVVLPASCIDIKYLEDLLKHLYFNVTEQ